MAYALHHRLSFGGDIGSAVGEPEIWECTVNGVGRDGTADSSFAFDSYLSQIKTNMATWFNAHSGCSNEATLQYLKLNLIGADGRYVDRTASHRVDYTPAIVGQSNPNNPDIISLATSWGTSLARGPGAHGRIYLPNPTYGTPDQMKVPASDTAAAAAAGRALLFVLNNGGGGGITWYSALPSDHHIFIPVVASKVNATNTDILTVKVGNVKDVQRRRKNALKETYANSLFLALTD